MSIDARKTVSVLFVFFFAAAASACSGEGGGPGGSAAREASGPAAGSAAGSGAGGATGSGGSSSGAPASPGGETPSAPPKADPSACGLPALTGVADVTPTFAIYDEKAGTVPPVMKGGEADGTYKVDKAIVYLPSSVKGLAKPASSTGTVNAWAIFDGSSYRLSLKADLSIDSIIGPQPENEDVAAQGTFSVAAEKLNLETACDPSTAPNAELSFSDQGPRATLLIKTQAPQGDVYLQLEATKQ